MVGCLLLVVVNLMMNLLRSSLSRSFTSYHLKKFSTSARFQTTWGFVGLGQMGYPMAKTLRTKIPTQDTIVIYDINERATKMFLEDLKAISNRVLVASSVEEVVEKSETIFTMLPEPRHVKNVFDTILSTTSTVLDKPRLFIDCSTIDIATSLDVGNSIRESTFLNAEFVDAPVSGGVVGAHAGTLTFMVGSCVSILPSVSPALSLMGSRVLHCGPPGSGLAAKLSNNYLLAVSNIATAEAMNLGVKLGLDRMVLKNLINVSSGRCWSSEINNPVDNAAKGFKGGFGISLMKKDLKLAIKAAEEVGAKLEMGEKARAVYESVEVDDRCVGKDFSVVYRWLGGDEGKESH